MLCALVILLAFACDDSPAAGPTPTTTRVAVASPVPTAEPTPDLAAQIGVRGELPPADLAGLAVRYGRVQPPAPRLTFDDPGYAVGHQREFSVIKLSARVLAQEVPPEIATINATLRAVSDRAYFYVEDILDVSPAEAAQAAAAFDATVWPEVTGLFGEPDLGGARIIVLQADLGGVGGYYAHTDTYAREVAPDSNEAAMIYVDGILRTGGTIYNAVAAHELQHLIHATRDPGEDSWVNEGLSEIALGRIAGEIPSITSFEVRPSTSLTAWDGPGSSQSYGAAAAFFRYLEGRFGADVLSGVAHERHGGAAGIEAWLTAAGHPGSFRELFADWIAANVLNLGSGPHGSPLGAIGPRLDDTLSPGAPASGAASQFGTDYHILRADAGGTYRLRFEGVRSVSVLPPTAGQAEGVLWANRGDWINTRLTRELDLTDVEAPSLTFRTWFDIERWWDWGYVAVSTDGGATWTALAGEWTDDVDLIGAAYGPGYTGRSGGRAEPRWVNETVSLAAFAGQKVLLRFEYVTDAAVHGEGWAISDVLVGGIGPLDPDGWESEGWVLIDRPLDQQYVVRIIIERQGAAPEVIDVPLDAARSGEVTFDFTGGVRAVLAIAGATEGTRQPAPYTIELHAD